MNHRRLRGSGSVWHCCRSCSDWPTADFEETPHPPAGGSVCGECLNTLLSSDAVIEADGSWVTLSEGTTLD